MQDYCMVCNVALSSSETHIKNVFNNKLASSKSLVEILEDILSRSLDQNSVHSKSLCQKCYKTCIEYDGYKSKMDSIKIELTEAYNTTIHKTLTKGSPTKPMSKIVVPASKLVPVPADFQLNFGQLSRAVSKANILSKSKTPSYNFKVSIGSSFLNEQNNTPSVKITRPSDSSSNVLSTVNDDITEDWNTNMVPKDIFSMTEDENHEGDENQKGGNENQNESSENHNENGDEEEHEMEIDEDCSMAAVPVTSESQTEFINIKTENPQLAEYADIITLTEGDVSKSNGNFVLGNFKIFNGTNSGDDDDDEQHTIVVNGDNASILEMMAGQKVVYENGGLSLVMEDIAVQNGQDDDDDAQDSNDESQIELQVSGDEETANAIIAAAQEEGGAFIKVESGEMYRVKSVSSTSERDPLDVDVDFDNHVTKHGDQYTCDLCQHGDEEHTDNYMEKDDMIVHLKKVHGASTRLHSHAREGKKRHDFTSESVEMKTNSQKRHKCSVCKKMYNSRTLLNEHMNTHTGAKPYTCHLCDKAFASKYSHQAHLKTHQNRPRPYSCEQCNKSFLTAQNLKQHENTHTGLRNFVCKICNKAFGTQHNLEIHGVVHSRERPFVCSYCGKGFCRKAELADHKRTHTGERPFECEICGARFAQRSNLHSHRRATHMDDKRHKCPECPKRFKRRRLLEYHIKSTHTGERPLRCEVCHATFVYPEHYKKHVKIHTGVRPFFCEICGKSFNTRDNRNMHRFTHSEKKPYECLECGQSYMRKRTLIQHMNDSGHLAESIVVNQPRVTRVHKNESGIATTVVDDNFARIIENGERVESAIFHTSGKLESLDKSATTIIADEEGKFFIDTGTLGADTDAAALLEAVHAAQIDEQATHLGTDDSGAVLRLIQVKLPNGADGWLALND